ncbi:hypothetical protein AB0I28_04350 [Phytomonospora sp. NPDC050363]|uniref:hypothetical protein n=1 Tax=Phytomonospora sp. NPDC050363 TaxID=3155642 RepID=UPI0033F4B3A7
MIVFRAVVEVPWTPLEARPPWPVTDMPLGSWLTLGPDCRDGDFGLFLAILAAPLDIAPSAAPAEIAAALLAEECLLIPGGIQVHDDSAGQSISPGCCSGLEDWRDWKSLLQGNEPWLGHDPTPEFAFLAGHFRLWQDGGAARATSSCVDIPRADLTAHLAAVHNDLAAFRDAFSTWSHRHVPPGFAADLATAIGTVLAVPRSSSS